MISYGDARRSEALRRWWLRHPEIPLAAVVVLVGAAVVFEHFDLLRIIGGQFTGTDGSWEFSPLRWGLMVVVMMLPGTAPMVNRRPVAIFGW